ncbi:MAG: UDP-3-O-(3-hydroxymyristoyl)glucosamine N-acyltransferase [Planctomycetes bacterium]|nr:UDP-3-O-(3-hydroxymyristoyl)glucosamine N-acyltransferase [Planctomycetota bacterium]
MAETLGSLAALLNADLVGDSQTRITGVAGLDTAREGDIVFAESARALAQAIASPASAIIVGPGINGSSKPLLRTAHPKYAFSRVVNLFYPPKPVKPCIDPTAWISESARIGKDVFIGPRAVIEEDVQIADRSVIQAGCYLAKGVLLGADCRIYPNVTIYHDCVLGDRVVIHSGTVIGGDGFGYVCHDGKHEKLLQLGNVVIEDDVEVGCNTCIDRASFGSTRVGRGTKIDNLVQIGHNAEIGESCIIVSQVGISGSSKIGRECILAGQVGVADHVVLEDRVTVAAQSGIPSRKRIPSGLTVFGSPARNIEEFKKQWAAYTQLPEQMARQQALVKEVEQLKAQVAELMAALKRVPISAGQV